jgi:hypothetical protein
MTKHFLKDSLLWGFILWFIGYALGIILFMFVPASILGWVISPIGTVITLWVLIKKIKSSPWLYYLLLGVVWTLVAVICDYFFLVKAFNPTDGYYKLNVYLYYTLMFVLPLIVGAVKARKKKGE